MRRRFKSIFKKDSGQDTKADDDFSTGQAALVIKQGNAVHKDQIQTSTLENLSLEDEISSGKSDSASVSLWDAAYDQLKEEEETRELIATYEGLLSGVSIKGKEAASLSSAPQPEDGSFENKIPQNDPIARRKVLNEIAQAGMQHMEDNQTKVTLLGHKISIQEGVGKVGEAVDWASTFVSQAVKDLPYAPAVTAGISLILPLLKNPATINDANLQGFAYVTSQMSYYAQMEVQLLPADMSTGLKLEMTNGVIELYSLIIAYQIRSVLRFYRDSTKNYFRSVVNYDDWEDQLSRLKEKEAVLGKRFETVFSSSSLAQLKTLSEEARAMRQTLNSDLKQLVDLSQSAEQRSTDDDFRRWIDTLKVVNPEHDKDRIQHEKGGLLRDSYRWVIDHADFKKWRDEGDSQLLWIKGDPGKGKTMLLCGIIDELSKTRAQDANIAYFFCQATNSRIREASSVLRGLLYTLVHQQPSLITYLRDGRFEGDTAWFELRKVFTKIFEDPQLKPTYLIIDALDECEVDLDKLLDFLVQNSSPYPRVKWIISSRNWSNIEEGLEPTLKSKLSLELNKDTVSVAVESFIEYKLQKLSDAKQYSDEIRTAVCHHLTSNSEGTFLWVALVCQRLTKVARWNVKKALEDSPPGLNELYKRMLDRIDQSDDADFCKSILAVVMTVFRPITVGELASCIDLPDEVRSSIEDLTELVGNCGSFLTLQQDVISLVHQSAKDFLVNKPAFDMIYPKGIAQRHHSIFSKSMQAMSDTLRRDIYGLVEPGYPISRVIQPTPDPLTAVRYPCVHWIEHFQCSFPVPEPGDDLEDSGSVGSFFQQDYLHWLEALSLLRSFPEGVASMLELESFLEGVAEGSYLTKRVQDASRFILYFKTGIESYPLQVYNSALVFSPTRSITGIQFEKDKPVWLKQYPVVEEDWDACLYTLESHGDNIETVAFSHDSRLLATGFGKEISLWESRNGRCLHTFQEQDGYISHLTFSHDSQLLGSVSYEMTVQIWDTNTGHCIHTFQAHGTPSRIRSLAISSDLKLLAFQLDSEGGEIKIWDINSKICVQTLGSPSKDDVEVGDIVLSHDSKLLASTSSESVARIWDCRSGKCLHTLKSDDECSLAFSPNSQFLASGSYIGTTLKIWDCSSGICLQTLEGYKGGYGPIAFSQDSTLLASVSDYRTICIWDIRSGQCLQTFKGHAYAIGSVVFSHNSQLLASSSSDRTVKVWRVGSQHKRISPGHTDLLNMVTFSADSKILASCSRDQTIKIWDTSSGQCIKTLHGRSESVRLVISHNSQLLASTDEKFGNITLWSKSSGRCIQTLEDHPRRFRNMIFIGDSKLLAYGSGEKVHIWNIDERRCIRNLQGHSASVRSLAISANSDLFASGSEDHTIILWDFNGGELTHTLKGHKETVQSLVFSLDSKFLASYSWAHGATVMIWNTTDGSCLNVISVTELSPSMVLSTSVNLRSLDFLSGYLVHDIGLVRFDPNVQESPSSIDSQKPTIEGPSISQDGSWIKWNSENLLWLPANYRPRTLSVSQSKLAYDGNLGQILFFELDSQHLSQVFGRSASD